MKCDYIDGNPTAVWKDFFAEIRQFIILAEGYRFLVRKKDFAVLSGLLKQHSYLL